MTSGLASDLRAVVTDAQGVPDHFRAMVPVGLLRAALIHVERSDSGPLHDRGREATLRAAEAAEQIEDIAA